MVTRAVYVLSTREMGGMEIHLLTLLRRLDRRRFSPTVVLPAAARRLRYCAALDEMAVPIRFHAMPRDKQDVGTLLGLARLLRQCAPHIVHVQLAAPLDNLYALIAARLAACPVVMSTEHSVSRPRPFRSWRARFFKQATVALQDCIITVCDYVRDQLRQNAHVSLRKVVTIYNGIEIPAAADARESSRTQVRSELGVDASTPLVGMVARIDPGGKRFDDFLRAAHQISREMSAARFVIVGDGDHDYCLALQDLARQLGLAGRVHFLGFRDDATGIVEALDTLVLASDFEGFPLVTLEAMARGTPVVATALGGLREQIQHGETGYLVPPRDASALAESVVRVLRDPVRSREVAERARRVVETCFDARGMTEKTQSLYEHLLAQKRVTHSEREKSLAGAS